MGVPNDVLRHAHIVIAQFVTKMCHILTQRAFGKYTLSIICLLRWGLYTQFTCGAKQYVHTLYTHTLKTRIAHPQSHQIVSHDQIVRTCCTLTRSKHVCTCAETPDGCITCVHTTRHMLSMASVCVARVAFHAHSVPAFPSSYQRSRRQDACFLEGCIRKDSWGLHQLQHGGPP